MDRFYEKCAQYAKKRKLSMDPNTPVEASFPDDYTDVSVRHKFYLGMEPHKWPGSNGCDSCLIAYDALLGAKSDWNELCLRGMLHGGDNDSTGTIAGAWFGALYGFEGVPKINYAGIEDGKKLMGYGSDLYKKWNKKK